MKKRIFSLMLVLTMLLGLLPTGAMAAEITTISTKAELEVFRDSVNSGNAYEGKTVTLTADIGLNGSEENPWTPIGTSSNQFQGAFDGGGHKITGLYINDSSSSAQGLFGCIGEGGTVKNLGVDGSVTGDSSVGGVAGTNRGTVENCYNTAAVTGDSTVGGVVGYSEGDVTNCYNTGTVSSEGTRIGGVAGDVRGTVANCHNTGAVTGSGSDSGNTGGVAGYIAGTGCTVTNCYNKGRVTGTKSLGGVVGYAQRGTVTSCYNAGAVSGSGMTIGGVAGEFNNATISNCYNTAAVTGRTWVGGVVGENYETTVRYCYNTGAVTSTINDSDIGGVIGFSRSTVTGCYYDNSVYTAAGTTSGVTGMPTADFAAQSSFSGWDFDTVWQMDAALGRPILRAAKEEPPHTHAVSTDCSATEGTQVNFTAWNKTDSLPDTAGNYVLTGDVALSKAWRVPQGTTNLCLNGHTVKVSGMFNTAAIIVPTGAVLNICDCAGGGALAHNTGQPVIIVAGELQLYSGVIAGRGYNSAYNGEYDVSVNSGGVFQMHGGSITGITTNTGCGVRVNDGGAFLMDGGTITENRKGVDVNSEGVFRAEGNVVVHGNSSSGSPRNVVMQSWYGLTPTPVPMELSGPLGANAKLGLGLYRWSDMEEVSPFMAVQGAGGYAVTADDFAKLSSDKPDDYPLELTDGKVYFTTPQSHSHPVCGETCAHEGDETHEAVTFDKALTVAGGKLCVDGTALIPDSNGVYTLGGGNYYLSDDITLNASIYIQDAASAPTNLCLNGHTLDLGEGRIDIQATYNKGNGVLNLCDCGAGGKITSANYGAYSNAATIEADYQFSLYSGTVENTAASGSNKNAVGFNGGSLSLNGGKLVSQSGNGLWVNCWQTDSLTLSGNVAIQGGTDQAEVYFSYPDTTWEDSTHFALAGPLTRPAAPWRVAVDYPEAEAMPLLEGWATHMGQANFTDYFQSATKRLFIGQLENKDLVLDICAITQQPTADNGYTVAANGAPASVPAYQWYPATVTMADITTDNATVYSDPMGGQYQPAAFADGKWTASEGYDVHQPGYFTLALQRGDKVTVTLATTDLPARGQLGLVRDFDEPGEYVQVWYPFDGDPEGYSYVGTAVTDGDNTIITYAIPADGSYDLRIDGLYGSDQSAPVISATLTRAEPGEALDGQTVAKLNTTGLAGGTYLCRVAWPDGTAINSDVVTYTPPHSHSWATAWTSDANGHWHACTAQGCDITDYASCGETGAAYGAHVYDNDQDATCNTCGYERELSYAISGTVTDHEGSRLENVTVTLMQGNTVVATATTDSQGNYSFSGVPAGLYNVAAEKDGVTKTILVEMTGANAAEKNIQMPEGRTNSVVEVKGSDTPAAVAGGVDAVAEAETEAPGQTVTVKLTVEAKEEPEDKAELDRVISGKKDDVLYLDLSLEKQINDQEPQAITDTGDKVLEIAVPYDFTGKKDVTVYRRHGEQNAEALDKLTARPAGSFADRAFFADSRSGMVYIYASKFSTYAIGYTETTTPNPPDSGSTIYYTLTATAGLGGAITPSGMVIVPRNGDKSFSITPDEGYVVADVLVDGESVGAVTEYTVEKVTANHTIAVSFRKNDGRPAWNPFVDVNTGHWFHDSVKAVYEQGLMVGTDRNHFSPDWDTSRAMIATIIWRLEGSPEPKGQLSYTDCSSKAYYAKAVAWGTENDVLAGYGGGLFGPDDPITREQLAAILWRCAGFPASSGTLTGFTDTDKASRYAAPALEWAVEQGIITGKGGGILDPLGKATRAETAAMFTRFCELRK